MKDSIHGELASSPGGGSDDVRGRGGVEDPGADETTEAVGGPAAIVGVEGGPEAEELGRCEGFLVVHGSAPGGMRAL